MLVFGFLFLLAFFSRLLSWLILKKQYEPKIKLKKGYYFSFLLRHLCVHACTHGCLQVINNKEYGNRAEFDEAMHEALTEASVDIVCLAGFMRILTGQTHCHKL